MNQLLKMAFLSFLMISNFGCVRHNYTNSECVEIVLKDLGAEFLNKVDQEAVKFVASLRCADYFNDPEQVLKSLEETK